MVILEDGTVLENIYETEPGCYEKDDRVAPCPRCDFGDVSDGLCNCCESRPWHDYQDGPTFVSELWDQVDRDYSPEDLEALYEFGLKLLRREFAGVLTA